MNNNMKEGLKFFICGSDVCEKIFSSIINDGKLKEKGTLVAKSQSLVFSTYLIWIITQFSQWPPSW